ncbi:MAG: radical SAM family heme chaperone HemW [Nannocystaceae bacterium]|nr:radical SAM family heme chaperone HemW [Nannocystaceae bacterium]
MSSSRVESAPPDAFGLYVHVPYCARACPYCDFDFRVDPRPDGGALVDALQHEVLRRDDARVGQAPHTIYVGGGTPSVLSADDLGALLGWIAKTWSTQACVEWTVECNPEHIDAARLESLQRAGVHRISLGVQSFDPVGLRQLGRAHNPDQACEAVDAAQRLGLAVSVDLIVGWPGQSTDGLRAELRRVLSLGASHVSVYALTIEPGTPWERLAERGVRRLPQVDDAADALECCSSVLGDAGFVHYEVASYAQGSAFAIHNTGYWLGRDYVGVGPSAASAEHRADGVARRSNPRGADWWAGEAATLEVLESESAAREALWLSLRLLDGLEIDPFLLRVQRDRAWLDLRTARARARGNVSLEGGRMRVLAGRWMHHDDIAADVL